MNYIVDANNLAGALGLLAEENFDQLLIDKFLEYNQGKGRIIYLVFDGIEVMGDRLSMENNIEVIYTPRDGYYKSADDKIVELVAQDVSKEELKVVSDDIDLRKRIEKISDEKNKNIFLERASAFAKVLERFGVENKSEKIKLSEKNKDKINKELEDLWIK